MNNFLKQIKQKQSMIKFVLLALMAMALFMLAGCGNSGDTEKRVAVLMPNSSDSWKRNGQAIKSSLEEEGFVVDLDYADTQEQQAEQIHAMLANNPKCLVIGAVKSRALVEALAEAKEKKVPVISYDRLIMDSDAVSYYVSFDNEAVGNAMGYYVEAALNLKSGAGPFNIEVFAGDPGDNNAHLFFDGTMSILKPYIDKGQLVCRSGETSFDKASTKGWKPENAAPRMERLVKDFYSDGTVLDVVIAPNDRVSAGLREAMAKAGYGGIPIMTGQDADPNAVKAVEAGQQSITIRKDPAQLSAKCIRMIKAVVEGTQPPLNDLTTYNNGALVVPSYLCIPMIIDKNNTAEAK